MKYVPPEFKGQSFTCPHCGVYSQFWWYDTLRSIPNPSGGRSYQTTDVHIANCHHCKERMVWFLDAGRPYSLYPMNVDTAPPPHQEMPEDVKADYIEARNISNPSPRGAAALLRLALQKLCIHLGGAGKNINDDISCLVRNGLPVQVQQALDVVRVTGNNAVHPGELVVEDDPQIVQGLFGLLNLIVDNRIAEPNRIAQLYSGLPEGARKAIEKRDS